VSDVKWIKLSTGMFEDEKIDFITSLPESDVILVIWIRLLALAGKCNDGGYIYTTEKIPYTDDMLSHKFRKPINIVKLALEIFKKLGVIDFDDNGVMRANDLEKWVKIDRDCTVNDGNWSDLRRVVLERDNYTCVYCGAGDKPLEADHVLPRSRGGLDLVGNLVCACITCNRSKGDKTPEEWRIEIDG
jgi:predicted phage replisome organizer